MFNFFDVIDLNFEDFDKIKRAAYWQNERLFVKSKDPSRKKVIFDTKWITTS